MKHAFGMLALYVRDVEKAKAFYTDFLGMKFVPEFSSATFVFLQPTQGTSIALQDLASLPLGVPAQPGGFEINLEVDDVNAAYQEWKAKEQIVSPLSYEVYLGEKTTLKATMRNLLLPS